MTPENYTHPPVAMTPEATAYDAIRVMENNHIGAVVVQESGNVTDRGLAIDVTSFDQGPFALHLGTVMSRPVQDSDQAR